MTSASPSDGELADRWSLAMRAGDFEAAWRISDEVLIRRRGEDCSHWPRHLQSVWNGAPLEGRRVLVRCYHGLGDTLMFVRLLARLRARAAHVALCVQPALFELLRDICGADEVAPLHEGAPQIEYDVDIELMELPHALRLSVSDLPASAIPYICVDGARVQPAAEGALRVGLVWRSGDWDAARTIPKRALRPLQHAAGVRWLSLQYPREAPPFDMRNLACRNLVQLAGRMRTLDLIISVDTMTAHLAGALGLPVWTLLPHDADWRWMTRRDDTPWYPTMRLFRQPRVGRWDSVVSEIASSLQLQATRAPDTRSAGCTASSG